MVLLQFSDWWTALSGIHKIFWAITIIFTILFLIQFVLSLIGLDFDSDVEGDLDFDAAETEGFGLDPSFTIFSVRSIIAFFTFFGWAGVLVLNGGAGVLTAVGVAVVTGLVAMFIVAYMMYWFSKLGEAGNVDVQSALYTQGEVYVPVPANKNGYGRIQLFIQNSLREMDAVTNGDTLPTGTKVRVVEILEDEVLLVEKADYIIE